MPTSPYAQIPQYITFLAKCMPESILDIGVGNGKPGFIARDFIAVMLGERTLACQWKMRLDGIEIFPDYIQEH